VWLNIVGLICFGDVEECSQNRLCVFIKNGKRKAVGRKSAKPTSLAGACNLETRKARAIVIVDSLWWIGACSSERTWSKTWYEVKDYYPKRFFSGLVRPALTLQPIVLIVDANYLGDCIFTFVDETHCGLDARSVTIVVKLQHESCQPARGAAKAPLMCMLGDDERSQQSLKKVSEMLICV
jgi:hypothetical protein